MFDRKKYKSIAKQQLQGRMQTPVICTLVILGILYVMYLPDQIQRSRFAITGISTQSTFPEPLAVLGPLMVFFIFGIINIAYSYLCIVMSHTKTPAKFSTFIKGFSFWLQGFLGFLWKFLWCFLWTLAGIVPGFVKAYAYSMQFFILAEHPHLTVRKALHISCIITNGHKADLFKLDMTFLGWYILSMLTGGLFLLWFLPYRTMTFINAYHDIVNEAFKSGILSPEDFEDPPAEDEGLDADKAPDTDEALNADEAPDTDEAPDAPAKTVIYDIQENDSTKESSK
ncbi:MAG TPA: hypothetical protein DCZ74_00390 [Treponema sp.]|nr:hypothetical protein [Treponema sp.]